MRQSIVLLGLAPVLVVAGCSTTRATPAPTATTTVTVTATPQPSKNASGTTALGEWQSVGNVRARVLEIKNQDASNYNKTPDASALVEVCAQVGSVEPIWYPWTASNGSGSIFPASNSRYDDYPQPGYPFSGKPMLSEGQCAKGWVLFEITQGTKLTTVSYTSDKGTTMTWGS